MRKVRYLHKLNFTAKYFTHNKIYDVIKYIPATSDFEYDYATVVDDGGRESIFRATNKYFTNICFEDVTTEYRNDIINGILR